MEIGDLKHYVPGTAEDACADGDGAVRETKPIGAIGDCGLAIGGLKQCVPGTQEGEMGNEPNCPAGAWRKGGCL